MAEVLLEQINKKYPKADKKDSENTEQTEQAVKNFNLKVNDGEFIVLVGPSGCGKSTTLRMIAGLEEITEGTLQINKRVVNDVPPKDRDIAMVFQNYALYPHMNAYQNMAFGLRLRKINKSEIKKRVQETAKMLGIENLLHKRPRDLAGGERQRVALGRAIVREPQIFLMDEPLSNLDAKRRVEMRANISRLHHNLGITTIYVTHDQLEAMTMGTRIVVMNKGLIQQVDSPINVYEKPINRFVAGFMGSPAMNFLRGNISNDTITGVGSDFSITVNQELKSKLASYNNQDVYLGIRPEDLGIRGSTNISDTGNNSISTTAEVVELLGAETLITTRVGTSQQLAARVPNNNLRVGDRVTLLADVNKLHAFEISGDELNIRYKRGHLQNA